MRTTQPQGGPLALDRGHPLARGLLSYLPLIGKSYQDVSDNTPWSAVASGTPAAFDATQRGLGLRVKGATAAYVARPIIAAIGASANQPLTLRFRLNFRSIASNHAIMSWGSIAQDGTPRFYVKLSGGSLTFFYASAYRSYSVPVTAATEYIVTHTFDGALQSTYVNGVLAGSAFVAWLGSNSTIYLGIGYDGLQAGTDFLISDFAMWSRPLSAQEVASDAQNPWQIVATPSKRTASWAATSTGGTTTSLTPANAVLTLAGYAPTVQQTVTLSLSPAQATLAVTGYAPSIAQSASSNIVPAAAGLNITGYAPTVTRTGSASVALSLGMVALTGYAPVVARTANQGVTPTAATLAWTGYAPTIFQGLTGTTPEYGISTIMRATTTNRTAALDAAPLNLTASLL